MRPSNGTVQSTKKLVHSCKTKNYATLRSGHEWNPNLGQSEGVLECGTPSDNFSCHLQTLNNDLLYTVA